MASLRARRVTVLLYPEEMRALIIAALACAPTTVLGEDCDDLIGKVQAAAHADVTSRRADFANFSAGQDTTLTLSCGSPFASSVGAQYRGDAPPAAYFTTFADASAAVTGIEAGVLREAAVRAHADATRLRHSNVAAGGILVTCSLSKSDKGALTMCAAIERDQRS